MSAAELTGKALDAWALDGARCRLIAARENRVYRVDHRAGSFALRLHRAGYRSDAELWSELQWMGALADAGLHVPRPVPCPSGKFLNVLDGVQIDMLTWLPGQPVGKTGTALEAPDRTGLFELIGQTMARMHALADAWTPPEGFTRCHWDRPGLLGEAPLWDRFWDNPTLSDEDRSLFRKLRDTADADLKALEDTLDYGLIHADLVRENIMRAGDRLYLIDFDDCGYGFRLFDLATTLLKNRKEPDYPALRAALIRGYRSFRALDTDALDLFMLLRSASYAGWIIDRMEEDGAQIRNARFISTTRDLARDYLSGR